MLTTFGEQRGWEPIGRGTQLAAKDPEYVSLQPAFYTAREMHFVVISLRNRLRIGSRAGKAARRNILPAPTTRSTRAEILQWQRNNAVEHDETLFKPHLLELVQAHKPPPFYKAVAIATMAG
ncbi:hypothetical protein PC113_g24958 [Phytophthora cactorum]|uniref:Uncharacterized protein n=1 Tax=Phytophthora cactorum TaxID=29920 RepID=A0A8T0XXM9_9STRA|nr:hypothetical protein PC113_g24958 [Phytophthora cactorum]